MIKYSKKYKLFLLLSTVAMIAVMDFSGCSSCSENGHSNTTVDSGETNTSTETNGTDSDTNSNIDSDTETESDSETDCIHPKVEAACANGWCTIQPGCFIYGSPESEPCRGKYSEMQVQVTITYPFLIKQTEVTRAEWVAAGFPDPSYGNDDLSAPVNVVNWFDALAFCNALSAAEGLELCYDLKNCTGKAGSGCPETKPYECSLFEYDDIFQCTEPVRHFKGSNECSGYRLPTTVEWEYAVRAGTKTATYNGNVTTDNTSGCVSDPPIDPIAWHCGLTNHQMPVGLKQPNGWGLYDMLGNMMEWVDYVYTGLGLENETEIDGPLVDPVGANEEADERRSLRGGWYSGEPCKSRAAEHSGIPLSWRSSFYGFRPVRSIFPNKPDAGPDGGN